MENFLVALKAWKGHRESCLLPKLKNLDFDLSVQWYGVNSAKTATAGLAVSSVVFMFVFPPVGFGLAIGAAVAGVGTTLGDWIAERVREGTFQDSLQADDANCKEMCKVAKAFQDELSRIVASEDTSLEEIINTLAHDMPADFWQTVREVTNAASGAVCGIASATNGVLQLVKIAQLADEIAALGQGVGGVIRAGVYGTEIVAMGGGGAVAGTRIVASTTTKVFGSLAAVVSVADAVYSWSTSKNVQQDVRRTIANVEIALKEMDDKLSSM